MSHSPIIRKATQNDLPQLLRFEQGVITAERAFDPTLKTEATRYYNLEEMLTASHIKLVIAELDGVLVGSGYARIETSKVYLQHNQHAYLGFMYVDPAHRGKGINQLIMSALEDWVRQQGVHELRLEVYYDNISAIKAYEKIGYGEHMIEMRKRLE